MFDHTFKANINYFKEIIYEIIKGKKKTYDKM